MYDCQVKENVLVRLLSVLYMSYIHSMDLSEFRSTYDYIFQLYIACLIRGMSHDRNVVIFDTFD